MIRIVTPEWYADATCAQVGVPDLWFPAPSDRNAAAAAQDVCRRCPVQADCLAYAIDDPRLDGVWGGTTKEQRARIRGRRRAG